MKTDKEAAKKKIPIGRVPKFEDLKDGEEYLYRQYNNEWVKAKIHHHWRGSLMVNILDGPLKGKDWYLFPTSMDRLRPGGDTIEAHVHTIIKPPPTNK